MSSLFNGPPYYEIIVIGDSNDHVLSMSPLKLNAINLFYDAINTFDDVN